MESGPVVRHMYVYTNSSNSSSSGARFQRPRHNLIYGKNFVQDVSSIYVRTILEDQVRNL